MIRTLTLSGALVLTASSMLPAQSQAVRWNDRPTTSWDDQAPQVRVYIDGNRGVGYGQPLGVRFRVSDNAFVTVVRVAGDGRMTILYPTNRNQRTAVRANQIYYARDTRLGGDMSFVATDAIGGYVFALASYAPLDLSSFENRDFDRVGGYSEFTVAQRGIARRPDVFIDRFAARVLWSVDTPYDYDVDYYSQFGHYAMNAYSLCSDNAFGQYYGYAFRPGSRIFLSQLSSWERMNYPYFGLCNSIYNRYECISWLTMSIFPSCLNNGILIARNPTDVNAGGFPGGGGGGGGGDSTQLNEGVIKGGMFGPKPVPIPTSPDDAMTRSAIGSRFDQVKEGSDLDDIMSIPARATRKMKEDDARRETAGTNATTTARTGFDRPEATEKPGKVATADANSAQPPSREPTKAKGSADPVRETTRSRTGFGNTGRTGDGYEKPRATPDRDASTRPAVKPQGGSTGGASLGGTSTTDKKKPPQN
jgi:hypothetical protein